MLDANSANAPFIKRHIGPSDLAQKEMLTFLRLRDLNDLIEKTVPRAITISPDQLDLKPGASEHDALKELRTLATKNQVYKSYLGLGYYNTHTPPAIQRNILENPSWYTQYTPYQAEISQGRLASLLNFQTMIMDLTAMPVANASVLDEATSAAEAMSVCDAVKNERRDRVFFIDKACYPQTISVVTARAKPRGIKIVVGDYKDYAGNGDCFGALLQYPAANGEVADYQSFVDKIHAQDGLVIVACDLLALALLKAPGEFGADFAVGSAQRFGVPLGFGGPHAGFFASKEEFTRRLPGRIIGVSKDSEGRSALRLSLQTREQHIRREKATSNICTAQALLANMAAMFAVYHGPDGIRTIADGVHLRAAQLKTWVEGLGHNVLNKSAFDTLDIQLGKHSADEIVRFAAKNQINIRRIAQDRVAVALDETTSEDDLRQLASCLSAGEKQASSFVLSREKSLIPESLKRTSLYLQHPVFNTYHSETELMRYMQSLAAKDLSLTRSMIPLGSCTMKLNAAAELMPVSWPEFNSLHPFIPPDQAKGYHQLFAELEAMLCEVTGFDAFSLQPNSGAQGEYAGLLAVKSYHEARGEGHRDVCLIPNSAHGTNPASAAMAGMKVVVIGCDKDGNVDLQDLRQKAEVHGKTLSCLMITYPSTHGVFEESIIEICDIIHKFGGQVYMDGANMNAQVGLCLPGTFGPDVCHLNLHKTFCIPHGGGGPGIGPIGVKSHLRPYLPSHPVVNNGTDGKLGPVSAAPWGSASILPISWMYIRMMGAQGLRQASQVAILNANYIAKRLETHYPVLYKGKNGFVAHECIIDLRQIQKVTGITVEDVAKRLMDYGFHAPTIAWPVGGTMMIEPTESESKAELDRFCEALIAIRVEISEIESGKASRDNNVVRNAPHTATMIASDAWDKPYSRERAVFPAAWIRENKFWPAVARIDNAFGDRNFVCSCLPIEDYV